MDAISVQYSVIVLFLSFALGAIGSLVFNKKDGLSNRWGNGLALLGSLLGIITAVKIMVSGTAFFFTLPSSFPLLSIYLRIDRLSAFFIFIISLVALVCSTYALGYVKHFYGKYNIGALEFFYNLFIAGMILVAMAGNAIFFLITWELMSLASYFLVIYERREAENLRAGYVYFVMTHIGTACIVLFLLILYRFTGSFDFEMIKNHAGSIPSLFLNISFVLALVGFGAKAGIIPFHIWLPSAHPAAPSHVSALMSGVMIKTGIYMLIRIFFDVFPRVDLWWGIALLIIGSFSALLGILYALSEHDLKKLLAFSSIENIGIILLGLGSAMVFAALHFPSLAALGLAAALFHILNHSIFKSLLFLGAGAVISKTHTRNIEKYGGLIKYMPHTALFFLSGSLAISAIPPLNGFLSEWLIFQSLFSGIQSFGMVTKWVFVFSAGALAMTGGLAAACFVKAFGISFLARPRSKEVTRAKDPALSLKLGMGIMAALTLVAGLAGGYIFKWLTRIAESMDMLQAQGTSAVYSWKEIGIRDGFASVSPVLLFVSVIVSIFGAYAVFSMLTKGKKIRLVRTWDCGTTLDARMEITSLGFSRVFETIFKGILKPTQQTDVEYRDANMRYFSKINFTDATRDVYREYLYRPLQELITRTAQQIKKIQGGNVNVYVLYILIALIGLLLFLTLTS